MTLGRNDRANSAASTSMRHRESTHSSSASSSTASSSYYRDKTPSWASMSYAEPNRRLEPLDSANVAFQDQFSGWLWMRGTKFGRWRHRYFCLNGAVLSYFLTFPSEEFLKHSAASLSTASSVAATPSSAAMRSRFQHLSHGTQPRGVVRIAHVDETESKIGFRIFGACGRKIDIRAHRVDERNDWLRALKTPARRKSRSWSSGSIDELTMSLASFDSDLTCTLERQSIPILKSGWLLKKSDVLKRWNRYFFVVQGRMISYYASEKPYEVPRRRGYIQQVQVVRSDNNNNEHELQIKLDASRSLFVRLTCREELEEWRETLLESVACRRESRSASTP